MAAIVHGGEEYLGVGESASTPPQIQVIVQDGAVNSDRIKVIANGEIQRTTRTVAKRAGRGLPSRGGGLLVS
jgi:hypothetical protein